jgi:hypothetical protein
MFGHSQKGNYLQEGLSSFQSAIAHGNLEAVKYLYEVGGQELLSNKISVS